MSKDRSTASGARADDGEMPNWFSEKSYSNISQEKITLARNMCLGSAGMAVLALFRLSTASELTIPLHIALYAFTVATPLFVALAFWYEAFVWLGEESYAFFNARRTQVDKWASVPILALYIGVVAMVWHLSVVAGILFLLISGLALFMLQYNLDIMRRQIGQASGDATDAMNDKKYTS